MRLVYFLLFHLLMKKIKQLLIVVLLFGPTLLCSYKGLAQTASEDSIPHSTFNKTKFWITTGAHVALWAGTYIALNKAWYADYPKEHFHFFNDNGEWNQMDKAGHTWTAYQIARLSTEAWEWTGLKDKTSVWLGGASALAYQSVIEIQDGFSAEWGFSWGDMAANTLGAGSFVAQELGWHEQRLQIKFSYYPYKYPADLIARRNSLFGSGPAERILKDYNSQTYWLSANLHSFWKESRIPKWLNVSFGYSSDLMLGAYENKWVDKDGTAYDYTNYPRIRRFYIAPDIDFTKIRTKSKLLRSVFFALNAVKFPAPTLEISQGKLKGHWLYF